MRVKENSHKSSGDLAQCWEDFKDKNDQLIEEYGLSDNQSLRYLLNLLCKDDHLFNPNMVKPVA